MGGKTSNVERRGKEPFMVAPTPTFYMKKGSSPLIGVQPATKGKGRSSSRQKRERGSSASIVLERDASISGKWRG